MSDGHRPYGYGAGEYGPAQGRGSGGAYGPAGAAGYDPSGTTPTPYGTGYPRDTVAGPLDDGYADPFAIGTPPFGWLVAAALFGAAGAVVAFALGATITYAAAAWVAAGPVAIGLLAVFAHRDTGQRARPVYDGRTWTPLAYGAAAVVALVGIGISAWRIAEWAGRL